MLVMLAADARTHLGVARGRTQPEEAKVAVMDAKTLPAVAMAATLLVAKASEANKRRIKARRTRRPRGNKSLRSYAMVQTRLFVTRRRRK